MLISSVVDVHYLFTATEAPSRSVVHVVKPSHWGIISIQTKTSYKDPKEKFYDEKTIRMKYPLNYLWQEEKDVIDSLKTNEDEKGCAIVLYAAKITKQKGKQWLD